MPETLKVQRVARAIPDGQTVTKRTGQKRYTLTRKIRFYADLKEHRSEIDAPAGCVFLCGNADVNVVLDDTELVWLTDLDTLTFHLTDQETEGEAE